MTTKAAINVMITWLIIVIIFHSLILLEVISYNGIWSGRLDSLEKMQIFETVSILLSSLLLFTLFLTKRNLQEGIRNILADMVLWFYVGLFLVNALMNIFSANIYEMILGSLFSFLSAILCFYIARRSADTLK